MCCKFVPTFSKTGTKPKLPKILFRKSDDVKAKVVRKSKNNFGYDTKTTTRRKNIFQKLKTSPKPKFLNILYRIIFLIKCVHHVVRPKFKIMKIILCIRMPACLPAGYCNLLRSTLIHHTPWSIMSLYITNVYAHCRIKTPWSHPKYKIVSVLM